MDKFYPIFFKVVKAIGVKNPTEGNLLYFIIILNYFRFIHPVCYFSWCWFYSWILKCLYDIKNQ